MSTDISWYIKIIYERFVEKIYHNDISWYIIKKCQLKYHNILWLFMNDLLKKYIIFIYHDISLWYIIKKCQPKYHNRLWLFIN